MSHLRIEPRDKGGHTIVVDGADITEQVSGLHFDMNRNGSPTVVLVYKCHTVTVDGETTIDHLCPLEWESDDAPR